jgi:hypothetical protein
VASSGPNGPSTSADNGGGVALGNAGAATASDGDFVTFGPSGSASATNYLKVTGFGFSIPVGATIDGIVVEWEKACETNVGGWTAKDSAVRIVKGGAIGSTDKSIAGIWPSVTPAFISHGGSSDLWGETWAYSDINDSTFGAVRGDGASVRDGVIDYCRITVYYTEAATFLAPRIAVPRIAVRRASTY